MHGVGRWHSQDDNFLQRSRTRSPRNRDAGARGPAANGEPAGSVDDEVSRRGYHPWRVSQLVSAWRMTDLFA